MRRLAVLLSLALLAACAHRPSAGEVRTREVAVGEARFRVRWWPGDDRAARQVLRALEPAATRAQLWGPLSHEVTITIHPDHAALEAAVDRVGYDWLRGWARFRAVDLQSPRSWDVDGGKDRRIVELLAHELTHCAMYQRAADERTWMHKDIPRWFSEGIASVTAGQGYRHGGPEDLRAFYLSRVSGAGDGAPGRGGAPARRETFPGDPMVDPDAIEQRQEGVVYGAAHHAVELLIRRYGEQRVRRVVDRMGAGSRFPAAFKEAIGVTEAEFAADFRGYVLSEGWKR